MLQKLRFFLFFKYPGQLDNIRPRDDFGLFFFFFDQLKQYIKQKRTRLPEVHRGQTKRNHKGRTKTKKR